MPMPGPRGSFTQQDLVHVDGWGQLTDWSPVGKALLHDVKEIDSNRHVNTGIQCGLSTPVSIAGGGRNARDAHLGPAVSQHGLPGRFQSRHQIAGRSQERKTVLEEVVRMIANDRNQGRHLGHRTRGGRNLIEVGRIHDDGALENHSAGPVVSEAGGPAKLNTREARGGPGLSR